jgi:hypothetical protein
MSSLFDPNTVADIEVTGAMETKRVPIPVGRYNFQVSKLTIKEGTIDDGDRKGEKWWAFELDCEMQAGSKTSTGESIEELTGIPQPHSRYQGFLDRDQKTGVLELGPGRNVDLGKIREAVGLNGSATPFKMKMLVGQVFNGEIVHRANPKSPGEFFAEIKNPLPRQ